MIAMRRLKNSRYIVFFPVGTENSVLKDFRAKYPELKYSRVADILQAYPSKIEYRKIYDLFS